MPLWSDQGTTFDPFWATKGGQVETKTEQEMDGGRKSGRSKKHVQICVKSTILEVQGGEFPINVDQGTVFKRA